MTEETPPVARECRNCRFYKPGLPPADMGLCGNNIRGATSGRYTCTAFEPSYPAIKRETNRMLHEQWLKSLGPRGALNASKKTTNCDVIDTDQ